MQTQEREKNYIPKTNHLSAPTIKEIAFFASTHKALWSPFTTLCNLLNLPQQLVAKTGACLVVVRWALCRCISTYFLQCTVYQSFQRERRCRLITLWLPWPLISQLSHIICLEYVCPTLVFHNKKCLQPEKLSADMKDIFFQSLLFFIPKNLLILGSNRLGLVTWI